MPTEPAPVIAVECPKCGKSYSVPASSAGKRGKCKECQTTFRVPDAPETPKPAKAKPKRKAAESPSEVASDSLAQLLAETIDFPRQPVTMAHRFAALLVACMMLTLPVLYLAVVVGAAWLTWWHATNDYTWISVTAGRAGILMVVFYVGLLLGGGLCSLFDSALLPEVRRSGSRADLRTGRRARVLCFR
jgi:hypothetical protein